MHDIDQPQDLSDFSARHQTKTAASLTRWFGEAQMLDERALAQ
jgi:hypothetical protein